MSTGIDDVIGRCLQYNAVDVDGIYQDAKSTMYKHTYLKIDRRTGIAIEKNATSDRWRTDKTYLRAHEYARRFSNEEIEITILETKVFK